MGNSYKRLLLRKCPHFGSRHKRAHTNAVLPNALKVDTSKNKSDHLRDLLPAGHVVTLQNNLLFQNDLNYQITLITGNDRDLRDYWSDSLAYNWAFIVVFNVCVCLLYGRSIICCFYPYLTCMLDGYAPNAGEIEGGGRLRNSGGFVEQWRSKAITCA